MKCMTVRTLQIQAPKECLSNGALASLAKVEEGEEKQSLLCKGGEGDYEGGGVRSTT